MFTRPQRNVNVQPAAPEMTTSIPSLTETSVMRSVNAAMFSSPEFNTATPAEEEVVSQGSETSEMSAVAEEDRMNGGTPAYEAPSYEAQYDLPAYARNAANATMTMERPAATRQEVIEEPVAAAAPATIDFSLPAYLRNRNMNANNF